MEKIDNLQKQIVLLQNQINLIRQSIENIYIWIGNFPNNVNEVNKINYHFGDEEEC